MNNLTVNTVESESYPLVGKSPQSIYDYFANGECTKVKTHTNGLCFVSPDGEVKRPYRVFNRSFDENPQYPYFRITDHSNSLLTAWHSQTDKEPAEFELLDLSDMSHRNIMVLRATGDVNSLIINQDEKLLAMVYHDDGWRVDIRYSENFQLREVVHHDSPVIGMFFYKDILFSLSDKLIVSFPEEHHGNCLVRSCEKVLGWAQHPTDPYLVLIEQECCRIINLDTMKLVKTVEWTEQIKWFNLLQKYSNNSFRPSTDNSIAKFSADGNRLLLGGYGQLALFDWRSMLRPRCVQSTPTDIIDIHSNNSSGEEQKVLAAHVTNMIPINRDKLLCATADGYLSLVNIRNKEIKLLLTPGNGVRMNSLQLCANNKYLAMVGYYYHFDNNGCRVESALLIWKLRQLINKGSVI